MFYETNRQQLKAIDARDVYDVIDRCNSRRLRITFCSSYFK